MIAQLNNVGKSDEIKLGNCSIYLSTASGSEANNKARKSMIKIFLFFNNIKLNFSSTSKSLQSSNENAAQMAIEGIFDRNISRAATLLFLLILLGARLSRFRQQEEFSAGNWRLKKKEKCGSLCLSAARRPMRRILAKQGKATSKFHRRTSNLN